MTFGKKYIYSSLWKILKYVESSCDHFIVKKAEYQAKGVGRKLILYYEIW